MFTKNINLIDEGLLFFLHKRGRELSRQKLPILNDMRDLLLPLDIIMLLIHDLFDENLQSLIDLLVLIKIQIVAYDLKDHGFPLKN